MRLRFGVHVLQSAPVDELIERVRTVQRWGFDHAWVADHYLCFPGQDQALQQSWRADADITPSRTGSVLKLDRWPADSIDSEARHTVT